VILTAAMACEVDAKGLSYVSFYDQEKLYGLSLSCNPLDSGVEVMVADQSAYSLSRFDVRLSRHQVLVTLPAGAIDPVDGEDCYEVAIRLDEQEFADLRNALVHILRGRARLEIAR
jgi:hypothetical protein